jgi:hypothetical protein
MEPDSSLGRRFPLRQVALSEAEPLLRETMAPLRAYPLRLIGLFLLLWLILWLVTYFQTAGVFFSDVVAAVAFTGYTAALDAASRSEPPDLRHIAVVFRFGSDKLILLLLSGVLPLLLAVLVVYGAWGMQDTVQFLDEYSRADGGHPSPHVMFYFRAAEYIASMPFTFVSPVWALYRWSGSRSMAANLLACVVNWRWVLALTGFEALADNLLLGLQDQGGQLAVLSLLGGMATQLLSLSWTLAVAQRCFPAR